MLTLREAIQAGRLEEFITQAETDGIGPADGDLLDRALSKVITSPQGSGRASGSRDPGGSDGK